LHPAAHGRNAGATMIGHVARAWLEPQTLDAAVTAKPGATSMHRKKLCALRRAAGEEG